MQRNWWSWGFLSFFSLLMKFFHANFPDEKIFLEINFFTYTLNLIFSIFFSVVLSCFTWIFCVLLYINLLIFHWKNHFFLPWFIFTVYSLTTSLLDWRFVTESNMRVLVCLWNVCTGGVGLQTMVALCMCWLNCFLWYAWNIWRH